MSAHTPGPWSIDDKGYGVEINPAGIWLGDSSRRTRAERNANACLIVVAPELLAALEQAVGWMDGKRTPINALAHARTIIAKAKGKA